MQPHRLIRLTTDPQEIPESVFIPASASPRRSEYAGTLTLLGYGPGRRLVVEEEFEDGDLDGVIDRVLAHDHVLYIHLCDGAAQCCDCPIERAA